MSKHDIGDPSLGSLSELAPELAETFVTVASDIALVVDLDGTIRSVAVGADSPTPTAASWVGRPWVDTVTEPTRRKIERLLHEVAVSGVSRRCEVDHLLPSGAGVPVAYSAVRLGRTGPVLAAGRDLRAIAAIQQRFVQAQQRMERDYWKRREAESRYRRLFHVATDAVLVVDGPTLKVVEGNPTAAERLGAVPEELVGSVATAGFDAASRTVVGALCAQVRASGQPAEVRAWLADRSAAVDVAATAFRNGDADLLLLRLRTVVPDGGDGSARLIEFVERTPDGVAITDTGGSVLTANAAFATLCGLTGQASAEGRPIGTWLVDVAPGASQPDGPPRGTAALLDEVRRLGFLQRVRGRLSCGDGAGVPVEVSATMLSDQDEVACIGFSLRRVDPDADADLPDSWALRARRETRALLSRVGELPLPDLLQQAAALAERHFVGRALELTDGDRDQAARLLGLERSVLDARIDAVGLSRDPKGPDHGAAIG